MGRLNTALPLLSLFHYKTVKYVVAENRKVGILYRAFQLTVIGYLIGYVFLTKKKYQLTDKTIQSSVKTKVRGVALINTSDTEQDLWGPEDYVIPQHGDNAFFVTTNFVVTPNQMLSKCPESPFIPGANCTTDEDCRKDKAAVSGNGIKTGQCLKNVSNSNGTCEIYGWCPVKIKGHPNKPVLKAAENFTLYIRNVIRFSEFNFTTSNIPEKVNKGYFKRCFYDKKSNCPVFRLGDIVQRAGHSFQEMAVSGGVIGILIEWDCDLDKGYSDCHPKYSFTRLDKANNKSPKAGYKFKFVRYFKDADGQKYRSLYNVYGIHFDIMVSGKAGQFHIIPTIVNLGSGLALMGAGAHFCDIILLYMMKKRTLYRVFKFETVTKYARYFKNADGEGHRNVFGCHVDIIVYGTAGNFNIILPVVNIRSLMGAGVYICDMVLLYLIKLRTLYRMRKFEIVNGNDIKSEKTEDVKRKASQEVMFSQL